MKHPNRESWLEAAVVQMTPLFKEKGYEIPKVRVACGWPVRGGLGKKKRVLGECWSKDASDDKAAAQIFISPALCDVNDPMGVLATLVHEVVHAVVGHKAAHNAVFGKCARAVGLEGKLTATNANEELVQQFSVWSKTLGSYPHSQLNGLEKIKKQSTRLLKCVCPFCGYTVRVTQKWLDVGAPYCPTDDVPLEVQQPEEKESDE